MPYAFEAKHIKLPRELDRRVKLTDAQRKEIKENAWGLTQRELARAYGVSRRLITYILDPAKAQRNRELREERGGWRAYYDKFKHREYIKGHRQYKKKALQDAQLPSPPLYP